MNLAFTGDAGEGVLAVFVVVYLVILLFACAVGLVAYLLQGFGVYGMGKTLKLNNPWLAFIPMGNIYILGKIAESCPSDKPKKYVGKLMGFGISTIVLSVFGYIALIVMCVMSAVAMEESMVVVSLISMLIWIVALYALLIAYMVFYYIALYKTYKLFAPNNAVLYLVLSIFVSISCSIILFILRKKQPVFEQAQN